MNKLFRQSDPWEVLGLNAFVIGPLGKGHPLRIINGTGRITKSISRHIHYSVWEVKLFEDIPDNSHAATSNRRGSLWNWGRRLLGMYWYSATLVSGMGGRRLSCSSSGCHSRDGCWEAIRITVVSRNPWSSGEFWGLWELEERCTLGLSLSKIWRGHLSPKLCPLGRVKRKLESPCSSPWQTCSLGGSLRQRTDWVRFPEKASILSDWGCWVETGQQQLHSWLREGGSEWEESQTGPKDEAVPEFCWTEIWNGSLPVCECRPQLYCCRSTREQSNCAT